MSEGNQSNGVCSHRLQRRKLLCRWRRAAASDWWGGGNENCICATMNHYKQPIPHCNYLLRAALLRGTLLPSITRPAQADLTLTNAAWQVNPPGCASVWAQEWRHKGGQSF